MRASDNRWVEIPAHSFRCAKKYATIVQPFLFPWYCFLLDKQLYWLARFSCSFPCFFGLLVFLIRVNSKNYEF